jgi:hypothetical protein
MYPKRKRTKDEKHIHENNGWNGVGSFAIGDVCSDLGGI